MAQYDSGLLCIYAPPSKLYRTGFCCGVLINNGNASDRIAPIVGYMRGALGHSACQGDKTDHALL